MADHWRFLMSRYVSFALVAMVLALVGFAMSQPSAVQASNASAACCCANGCENCPADCGCTSCEDCVCCNFGEAECCVSGVCVTGEACQAGGSCCAASEKSAS